MYFGVSRTDTVQSGLAPAPSPSDKPKSAKNVAPSTFQLYHNVARLSTVCKDLAYNRKAVSNQQLIKTFPAPIDKPLKI